MKKKNINIINESTDIAKTASMKKIRTKRALKAFRTAKKECWCSEFQKLFNHFWSYDENEMKYVPCSFSSFCSNIDSKSSQNTFMLTLVFGMPVSKGKVNRSLDLCLIAKETTGDCEQGFVFKHIYWSVWSFGQVPTLRFVAVSIFRSNSNRFLVIFIRSS